MNVPPARRAKSAFKSAVRALPMWISPVGDGAKRTMGGIIQGLWRTACGRATLAREASRASRWGQGTPWLELAAPPGVFLMNPGGANGQKSSTLANRRSVADCPAALLFRI